MRKTLSYDVLNKLNELERAKFYIFLGYCYEDIYKVKQ